MTALTPENARPGLRVKCIRASKYSNDLRVGDELTIRAVDHTVEGVNFAGGSAFWEFSRFVLAEPARPTLRALLAEHDPEFLAAVVGWYESWRGAYAGPPGDDDLYAAIERANLHAPAEVQAPGVTDARASISEGWWV